MDFELTEINYLMHTQFKVLRKTLENQCEEMKKSKMYRMPR